MAIHTVTKETTVQSEVEVIAAPGTNPRIVLGIALEDFDVVRKYLGLLDVATDINVDSPVYQDNRHWLVKITTIFRKTEIVDDEYCAMKQVFKDDEKEELIRRVALGLVYYHQALNYNVSVNELAAEMGRHLDLSLDYLSDFINKNCEQITEISEKFEQFP